MKTDMTVPVQYDDTELTQEAAREIVEAAGDRPILLVARMGHGAPMLAPRIAATMRAGKEIAPYRAPHFSVSSVSDVAMTGGGTLFLEAGPEFDPEIMEAVGRAFRDGPARFRLIVHALPCPYCSFRQCQYLGRCDHDAKQRYHARLDTLWARTGEPFVVLIGEDNDQDGGPCTECGGSGYYRGPRLGDEPCEACHGSGDADHVATCDKSDVWDCMGVHNERAWRRRRWTIWASRLKRRSDAT